MASCGFATLVGGSCGSSADNPANVQCVVVESCAKSTQGHLRSFLHLETPETVNRSSCFLEQVREYISLVLPYHLCCKPNAK